MRTVPFYVPKNSQRQQVLGRKKKIVGLKKGGKKRGLNKATQKVKRERESDRTASNLGKWLKVTATVSDQVALSENLGGELGVEKRRKKSLK